MVDSTFGIDKKALRQLLDDIHEGALGLPEFQRSWVWPQENIASLIASISNGYPVGTLMLLATGGQVRFKTRVVEGSPAADGKASRLILDGQQRMTSLYQALLRAKPIHTHDSRKRAMVGWFYVDMQRALSNPADREDAIVFVPEDKVRRDFRNQIVLDVSSRELEHQELMFPLNEVFDYTDWMIGFIQAAEDSKAATGEWKEFKEAFLDPIVGYQVPVIEMGAATQREAVVQVFERVNTGGVTLTVFELLTASFAADEFDLRQDWERRRANWSNDQHQVLKEVANTDFLQAICLLSTYDKRKAAAAAGKSDDQLPRIGARRADMLALSLSDYKEYAPRVVDGLMKASKFLHTQGVYEAKFLPYGSQLIPLATILAALGNEAQTQAARDKVAKWYWSGVFGELYGGSTETRFARDLPEVVEWVGDPEAVLPRTVQESQFFSSRLGSLRSRNSAAYKGLYVLLLQLQIADWLSGQTINTQHYFDEGVDIHHVFPKAWCEEHGIHRNLYDSILNKTPLSARTNRIIGGRAPSQYIQRLVSNAGVDKDKILGQIGGHFIDPTLLEADNFTEFLKDREWQLLGLIARATGKKPQIDTDHIDPDAPLSASYEDHDGEMHMSAKFHM